MSESILSYEERGEGMPVVLVHGFPFDHTIWEEQLDALSKDMRVLAPDLPGFGRSQPLASGAAEGEPQIADYADYLARWADDIDLPRFVLVGHSMGGYIALAFVAAYANRLAGLGLLCTRPGADTEEGRAGRYRQIEDVWKRGPAAVADAMLPKLFSPQTSAKHPEIIEQTRALIERQTTDGIVTGLRAMANRPDSAHLLGSINVPTVVITGEDDQIIPATEADLMAANIPGAAREIIQSAGHMPMLERPDELNALLFNLALGSRTVPSIPEPPPPGEIDGVRRRP
jgi:3-oxoadipate enol-lactonase